MDSRQRTNQPDWGINRSIDRFAMRLVVGLAFLAALAGISYAASYNGAKNATSATTTAATPQARTVTVAMHDPGCHWFQVGSQLEKSMSVNGPVKVLNSDEAAIQVTVTGAKPMLIPMGQTAEIPSGPHAITMVGQEPDDNTLSLQVS